MKRLLSALVITGLLWSTFQSTVNAQSCDSQPYNCSSCLYLINSCDLDADYEGTEAAADADTGHPCHIFCQ